MERSSECAGRQVIRLSMIELQRDRAKSCDMDGAAGAEPVLMYNE